MNVKSRQLLTHVLPGVQPDQDGRIPRGRLLRRRLPLLRLHLRQPVHLRSSTI